MIRFSAIALGALAFGFTGCGDEPADAPTGGGQGPAESRPPPADDPPATEQPPADAGGGGFSGQAAENYDLAKVACGAFPPAKVARDLGLPVDGDTAVELGRIAERYARGYTGSNRQAAFEGCLDGLPNPR
jgi:hypothetical protein